VRYFLEIAYDGSAYHGWQFQQNAYSVQQELNEKISFLLREPIEVTGSGRTDTGVHCLSQFAHFDTSKDFDKQVFTRKINSFLKESLVVKSLSPVTPNAHARFDATSRTYLYRISPIKNPFSKNHAWQLYKQLDINAMNKAAALLLPHENFEVFSKTDSDVAHHRCQIMQAGWVEMDAEYQFTIRANRFLRGMVRLVVGALVGVGLNQLTCQDFEAILNGFQKDKRRIVAPAHGLYLKKVEYPADIFLAQ
jgi:tRNA pseudouridine38-40 synthase